MLCLLRVIVLMLLHMAENPFASGASASAEGEVDEEELDVES